jgi:hypothetical protein
MKNTPMVMPGLTALLADASFAAPPSVGERSTAQPRAFPDASGVIETLSTAGPIDRRRLPVLLGLVACAPYFHTGAAADPMQVVESMTSVSRWG